MALDLGRFACKEPSEFPADAIWDGQSRMIPCQGECGWKQSQSGN